MPRYEVHIPGAPPDGLTVTFRVDAPNWMQALKTGFLKLGQSGLVVHNVLVDVTDDGSLHVTEGDSGRVFRIRELSDEEAARAKVKAPPAAPVPAPDASTAPTQVVRPEALGAPPPPAQPPAQPVAFAKPAPATPDRPVGRGPRPTPLSTPALVLPTMLELTEPTQPVRGAIGRTRTPAPPRTMEDVLAEVFNRVQGVYQYRDAASGLYFLLDLALEKIPAEAGSALSSELITGTLRFVAVRGPKAKEILESRTLIPAGQGIAGFCTAEGVSLALSDVHRDQRWYSAIADRLQYETRSLLCSPMVSAGRAYGCLELVNRTNSSTFTDQEVGLLAYIAHQGALFLHALG